MQKIYIIDSSGYIFRAFYAVTNLTTKAGFPTNALYGFLKMYIKLLEEIQGDHIVSVFDTGKKNFRHEIYTDYKANRAKCPDELSVQMPYFREFVKALGIKVVEKEGYEADDIIASLTKKAVDFGYEVEVISADKDLMQLVSDNVLIWDTMKDKHYDREGVKEKLLVEPEKVSLYLSMVGDTSDNVPGIKGLGPKTVSAILKDFGSVEEILNNLDVISNNKEIRGAKGVVEKIKSSKDDFILSKKLVDLDYNVPLEYNEKEFSSWDKNDLEDFFKKQDVNEEDLNNLIQKFEFQSLFKGFAFNQKKQQKAQNVNYITVYKDNFDSFISTLKKQKVFAFDTETTSLDIFEAKLVGVSICFEKDKAYYIPLGHKEGEDIKNQVSIKGFVSKAKDIFEDEKIKKTGHNVKYDIEILKNYDIEVKGVEFDSMISSYLLSPDEQSFSLSFSGKKYLGLDSINYKDVVGKKEDFSYVSIKDATNYSAQDAHYSYLLYLKQKDMLKDMNLTEVFYKIDMPLIDVLVEMETNGVFIDADTLLKTQTYLQEEIKILEKEIYSLANQEFNLNSPKQLQKVLFEDLKISTFGIKKNQSGFSTDVNTLQKLSAKHKIARDLLKYRMLFKLKSTYVDSLLESISKKTGRVHTKYNQAAAGTGRLSSSEPNLQNIPIRTQEGKKIRTAFIAPKGKVIISADYSQIELRVLAHLSSDKTLINSFKNNEDIHSNTAKFIFDLGKDEEPTSDQRRLGKTINFGVIYGMSSFRLSNEIGINIKEAQRYIEEFFKKYSGVKKYFDMLLKDIEEKGFVTTLFGRKRFSPMVDVGRRQDRGYLNRMAINAPIQGTSADLIKMAMINIHKKIDEKGMPLKMIMQIHDELVFECDEGFLNEAIVFIKEEMEKVVSLNLPLKVDVGYGASWEEAH